MVAKTEHLTLGGRENISASLVGGCGALQLYLLSLTKQPAMETGLLQFFALAGFAVALAYLHAKTRTVAGRSLVLCLVFGGLGMVIGSFIDGQAAHLHHQDMGAMLASWMTALMLLFCVPSCGLLCKGLYKARSGAGLVLYHAGVSLGMLAGMMLGLRVWADHLMSYTGSGYLPHHAAMLAGMALGTWLGVVVFSQITELQHHAELAGKP